MNKKDMLYPFIFDNADIRGNLASISESYQQALAHQSLPTVLRQALGELMVASALLISTVKLNGKLTLQLQGNGMVKLLVVECTSDLCLRATAKYDSKISSESFFELISGGHFVITLIPNEGEPYQGIVALEGNSIAHMLENYMLRSQQIDTSIWLFADDKQASGMLLQKLPSSQSNQAINQNSESWQHINQLANTITHNELITLPPETLLPRLFYEEQVRLFSGRPIMALCSCSRENVSNMITLVGQQEIASIIQEQGSVQINCDFCNKQYVFDELEIAEIFTEEIIGSTH